MTSSNDSKDARTVGTVLAVLEAGATPAAQGLVLMDSSAVEPCRLDGAWVLRMSPGGRYYEEDVWAFRIEDAAARRAPEIVVEIEFLDEGYGIMAARRLVDPAFNGKFAAASRRASYARLGTGRLRRAAFGFDAAPDGDGPGAHADIELTGAQYVRAVRILGDVPQDYWDKLREEIPSDITPAVALERPMEIVCSADGALSGHAPVTPDVVQRLRESLPLAKALGFTAVESYVRWNHVEPELGRFDWSIYDTVVAELERVGLKWFPLLIVGSAYALPEWFHECDENIGFVCLEHGLGNPIQSIWSPHHKKHVTRFLEAFGAHYESRGCLEGVRLGPSGNFGESQYPAGGNWGFLGEKMHIHIGMWAGDPCAREDFVRFLRDKYGSVADLNAAWNTDLDDFDTIRPTLPDQCASKRQRADLNTWYIDSMSQWCEWWAVEARRVMPNTPIYQSSGGWGAVEIGTDYSAQTKSMVGIDGGIRLTNELDSFHQSFYATRLAATAARCYDVPLGFEPAMGHTARGVAGRLFNCMSNNGRHFFIYHPTLFSQQTSIESWLRHYPLLDARQRPHVEVAVYYPQTTNFLSSDTFRYLNAWGFNPYAREIRDHLEIDYLDDRLIQEGHLDAYKALAFVWGEFIEADTLERIDEWLRAGGAVIFPYFLNARLRTVEDDASVFQRWVHGDVGAGRFFRYRGDDEPPSLYAAFVRDALLEIDSLSDLTRTALTIERPDGVFISIQEDGHFLVLNFTDHPARVSHPGLGSQEIPPYTIERLERPVPDLGEESATRVLV